MVSSTNLFTQNLHFIQFLLPVYTLLIVEVLFPLLFGHYHISYIPLGSFHVNIILFWMGNIDGIVIVTKPLQSFLIDLVSYFI